MSGSVLSNEAVTALLRDEKALPLVVSSLVAQHFVAWVEGTSNMQNDNAEEEASDEDNDEAVGPQTADDDAAPALIPAEEKTKKSNSNNSGKKKAQAASSTDLVGNLKRRVWEETIKPALLEKVSAITHTTANKHGATMSDGSATMSDGSVDGAMSDGSVDGAMSDGSVDGAVLTALFDVLFGVCCFLTHDHRMAFERLVGPKPFIIECVFGKVPPSSLSSSTTASAAVATATMSSVSSTSYLSAALPLNTWSLQEGAKMLRKFVLCATGSPIARQEGFYRRSTAPKAAVTAGESALLEALMGLLLHSYLPRYVQQYPSKEAPAVVVVASPATGDEEDKDINNADGAAAAAVVSSVGAAPTAVVGFPNVAICECSLAPTVYEEEEGGEKKEEMAANNADVEGDDDEEEDVTGLALVEGSLVLNPALLEKEKRNGEEEDDYILEPFCEVVRVPRHELFFMGTAKERCAWTRLMLNKQGKKKNVDATNDTVKQQQGPLIAARLRDSIPDDEARLLLSFVFEATKQKNVEAVLNKITNAAAAASSASGAQKPTTKKTIAAVGKAEESSWSLLMSRCPISFPTVPSFWAWGDLSFLFGTNVLDETTSKRTRLDSVTEAIRFALYGNIAVSSSSSSKTTAAAAAVDDQTMSLIAEFLDNWDKKERGEEDYDVDGEENEKDDEDDDSYATSSSSSSSSSSSDDSDDDSDDDTPQKPVLTPAQKVVRFNAMAKASEYLLETLFPHLYQHLVVNASSCAAAADATLLSLAPATVKKFCPAVVNAAKDFASSSASDEMPNHAALQQQMFFVIILDKLIGAIFSSENVQWARAVFDSRAFNLNLRGSVQLVLAPVADMINHSALYSDILVRRVDDQRVDKSNNETNKKNEDSDGSASDDDDTSAGPGDGDMIMQLGAGVRRSQLVEGATRAYPHKELYMSYGPLQNWELLLSYGFALGDVVKQKKSNDDGSSASDAPLALSSGNPYDRLPLPIDLQGTDEGNTAIDAAYSQRRRAAILKHGLSVGNGVWIGCNTAASASSVASPAAIFPAVVALMRLYCATVEEFTAVETDPFAVCPNPATEAQVWASLRATMTAVVAVVGAGCVQEDDDGEDDAAQEEEAEEENDATAEDEEEEETDDAFVDLDNVAEEVSVEKLKASIQKQLRRIDALNGIIGEYQQKSSSGKEKKANGDVEEGEDDDDDEKEAIAASAVNERMALLVSVPLRQIAVDGLEYCDTVIGTLPSLAEEG